MSAADAAQPLDVSVIIPAYNREGMIGRAVLSALKQQPRPAAEVIVIDDGSVDGTGDMARRLGATVVRQPNQGEGPARNAGVAAATSTWVAFLDSDDEWLPQHLDVLRRKIDGRVLVGSAARCVPSGRLAGISRRGGEELSPASLMWPQSPLVPSATMVRRDVAEKVGFRSLPTAADLDFFIRCLEHGTGYILPDVTAIYFEHAAQISVDNANLKRGRNQVLRQFEDRPWFPRSLLQDVAVSDRWDEFRHAQRTRDWKVAARLGAQLTNPKAVRALTDVWRYRLATRRH